MVSNNSEHKLLELAVKTANQDTGLEFVVDIEPVIDGIRCDATLKVKGYDNLIFVAEIKKWTSHKSIGSIASQIQRLPKKGILIADYVNPNMADKLKKLDVQFMDTVGNIYINEMPLFIFVKGNKKPNHKDNLTFETMRRGRAFQPTGLKVVFAMLTNPKLVNAPYREIADVSEVALGSVGWVINDLKQGNYLIEYNKHRRLNNISKLTIKWVDAYIEKLRPKLFIGLFSTDKLNWLENIVKYKAKLGGETAAEILTGHLKPEVTTIYLNQDNNNKLMLENRLRKDKKGKILVFKSFWNNENIQASTTIKDLNKIVHPLIIYADLIATQEQRNIETARIIYDKYLPQITKQD